MRAMRWCGLPSPVVTSSGWLAVSPAQWYPISSSRNENGHVQRGNAQTSGAHLRGKHGEFGCRCRSIFSPARNRQFIRRRRDHEFPTSLLCLNALERVVDLFTVCHQSKCRCHQVCLLSIRTPKSMEDMASYVVQSRARPGGHEDPPPCPSFTDQLS